MHGLRGCRQLDRRVPRRTGAGTPAAVGSLSDRRLSDRCGSLAADPIGYDPHQRGDLIYLDARDQPGLAVQEWV